MRKSQIDRRCNRPWFGWWCSRSRAHTGPCTLRPEWWNVKERWRRVRFNRKWS